MHCSPCSSPVALLWPLADVSFVFSSQAEPLYELVTATDFAYSSTVKQNIKKALEEFQMEVSSCHCAPCQGNGIPVLKGTIFQSTRVLCGRHIQGG